MVNRGERSVVRGPIPPESTVQRVNEALQIIRETGEQGKWMQIRTSGEAQALIPQLFLLSEELRASTHPFWIDGVSKVSPGKAVRDTALLIARENGRIDAFNDAYNTGREVARGSLLDSTETVIRSARNAAGRAALKSYPRSFTGQLEALPPDLRAKYIEARDQGYLAAKRMKERMEYDLGWAAACEALADFPVFRDRKHLYWVLFELYQLGAVDVTFQRLNGEIAIASHLPLLRDTGSVVLGCWVEGEEEIAGYHRWEEGCETTRDLNAEQQRFNRDFQKL